MSAKPLHWPFHVQYIRVSQFHTSVPSEIRLEVQGDVHRAGTQVPRRCSSVVIRSIACPSHPAHGQYGLFAAKKIPPQTHIIDYIGEIHCDDRPHSDYDLSLCRFQNGTSIGIDASLMGNEARFINDYRGIIAKPNAVFSDVRTPTGEMRMSIWSSTREIKKGEEILVSYGKTWWRARSHVPE